MTSRIGQPGNEESAFLSTCHPKATTETMRERLVSLMIYLFIGPAAPYAVASVTTPTENFHIQGWRWHTQSLARDAKRLSRLASMASTDEGYLDLKRATEYTIDFNMRGLHKIETDVFFPWVRGTVVSAISSTTLQKEIKDAIQTLEDERRHLENLGKLLVAQANALDDDSISSQQRSNTANRIADLADQMAHTVQSMSEKEEASIVPAIAQYIPEQSQKSLNNRVIRKLGLLNSRIHLVSMYETIRENRKELDVFEQVIPSLPRRLLPRWKRNLYEPIIGGLQIVDD